MAGLEVVVGMLVGWFARRTNKKVHDLVAGKLHDEPALKVLEAEVVNNGEASTRTQARVRLALEEAVDTDESFATQLDAAVQAAQGPTAGPHGVAISGGVNATSGGIAIGGVTGGSVSMSREDPS